MAKVHSAVQLKDWVLRQLGAPVIQVEVTDDQIYDCIDEAIELFTEFHYDGAHKNVVMLVVSEEMADQQGVYLGEHVYAVNKVIHGRGKAAIGNDQLTKGFVQLFTTTGGYGSSYGHSSASSLFSELSGFSMTSYYVWKQYESEFNKMFNPAFNFAYNSTTNELKLLDEINAGDILAFEVYTAAGVKIADSKGAKGGTIHNGRHFDNPLQPQFIGDEVDDDNPYFDQKIFDNRWIKEYSRALVKRVHGTIMKKYDGAKLPGGASVNGASIYQEAVDEMRTLREELDNLDEPMPVFMG